MMQKKKNTAIKWPTPKKLIGIGILILLLEWPIKGLQALVPSQPKRNLT